MKFKDLIKPIDDQTEDELRERLREIRFNRERARPVAKKKAEKAEKKESRQRTNKLDKMIANLSPAQLEEMLKKLQGEGNG